MDLEWIKHRDPETTEVYHELFDHIIKKTVVSIRKPKDKYRVQVLDHVPFETGKLTVAKSAGQCIYEAQRVRFLPSTSAAV